MYAEFDESLVTGNEMIDGQHKELIGKINKLVDCCEQSGGKLEAIKMLDYLDGCVSLDQAVCTLKRDTRHFAKRQLTWFKREKDVRWLNLPDFHDNLTEVLDHILQETRELWN